MKLYSVVIVIILMSDPVSHKSRMKSQIYRHHSELILRLNLDHHIQQTTMEVCNRIKFHHWDACENFWYLISETLLSYPMVCSSFASPSLQSVTRPVMCAMVMGRTCAINAPRDMSWRRTCV